MRCHACLHKGLVTVVVLLALMTFSPLHADWTVGDPHKMHFPQLPDPMGWDIEISSIDNQHELADDWQCSQTGPVEDVHFWTSWNLDAVGIIEFIEVKIYTNIPDPDPGDPSTYSQPGVELWSRVFDASQFTVVSPYGTGDQGFADPQQGVIGWVPMNHVEFQQINIVNIEDPFTQQDGEIYWLGIHVWWSGTQEPVGWKTTQDKFEDTAVYRDSSDGPWVVLINPLDGERLELAFVITGEPPGVPALSQVGLIVLALLLAVGLAFAIRRLRKTRPA